MAVVISGIRHEGATVENIKWGSGGFLSGFDGIGAYSADAFAEAVVMDLGREKGLLFGLIFPPQNVSCFDARRVSEIFALEMPDDVRTTDAIRSGAFFRHIQQMTGEYALRKDNWPVLVRFRDMRDPTSAQIIAPDQLEAVYGPDSHVDNASVEITHDSITSRIDRILPWLSQTKGAFSVYAGPSGAAPDAAKLTGRCFRLKGEAI